MTQPRKKAPRRTETEATSAGRALSVRPLTARSVVASTLLGVDPPRLPARLLVRSGELFGISDGTTRVALSRMLAAGELEADDGGYRLAGPLLARQARQQVSRAASRRPWDGTWSMAVVAGGPRPARERSELREAMRALRMAELREGVWLRPDNLDAGRSPESRRVLAAQCDRLEARPDDDPSALAARLWDLSAWSAEATRLGHELEERRRPLERGDASALAAGFVLSAAVLRHLVADPLLPDELLPPGWPGADLRAAYEGYDEAFKAMWREWFRSQPAPAGDA